VGQLFYGDNLDVLRRKIKDETADLCYIDPPFNSKRNYFQIYNNIGEEDKAQAQAFMDTWTWDDDAIHGYREIITNFEGRFTRQAIELIKGLKNVLGEGGLLAYLVSMTLRVTEIQRILKPTGSFYLHCDPTASHYLKLILDAIFCGQGGQFQNEIAWCYSIGGKSKKRFGRKHDVIFFYTKSDDAHTFNEQGAAISRKPNSHMKVGIDADGREYQEKIDRKSQKVYRYYLDEGKIAEDYWTDIETLNREDRERLGYPTQKPEALLERIIKSSSNDGDTILDAYCGCGTTVVAAERLNRRWIGIDITYQSISLILRRLQDTFPDRDVLTGIILDGIPQDMGAAQALAHKKDDRVRKEFEKWAVLMYSNNRAVINTKKGADKGIDGTAYFLTSKTDTEKIIFQVKSGAVNRSTIATLRGDMERENAQIAILITLEEPTKPMREEAAAAGLYEHKLMGRSYNRIQIVTVQEIIEQEKRLEMPLSIEVIKSAAANIAGEQLNLGV
jgi:DNA modification methylase